MLVLAVLQHMWVAAWKDATGHMTATDYATYIQAGSGRERILTTHCSAQLRGNAPFQDAKTNIGRKVYVLSTSKGSCLACRCYLNLSREFVGFALLVVVLSSAYHEVCVANITFGLGKEGTRMTLPRRG